MSRQWWKKGNELLAITACSCTFGAFMLEVGIYASQRDAQSLTTEAGGKQNATPLTSEGAEVDIDTGPFELFGSDSSAESFIHDSSLELREKLKQAQLLRELLIQKLREQEASGGESKDAISKNLGDSG